MAGAEVTAVGAVPVTLTLPSPGALVDKLNTCEKIFTYRLFFLGLPRY